MRLIFGRFRRRCRRRRNGSDQKYFHAGKSFRPLASCFASLPAVVLVVAVVAAADVVDVLVVVAFDEVY